jgi:hypothetical protein
MWPLCKIIENELKLYESENIIKWISIPNFKIKGGKNFRRIVDRPSTTPPQTTVADRSKLKMTESMI